MYSNFISVPFTSNILPFDPPVRSIKTADKLLFESIDNTNTEVLGRNALGLHDVVEYKKNEHNEKDCVCPKSDD